MEFDYVIVGGGSSGCVLANRLSEDPATRVLLIEAGGEDRSPFIRIPAGEMKAIMSPSFNWNYMAEPDASRGGRADMWPAGKVLGGGSSINGMMYVRGNRGDYDHWAQLGCTGWDYEGVLPYFNRAETNENGGSEFRGGSGPLSVQNVRAELPITKAFIQAGVEAGLKFNADVNGASQDGIGPCQATQRRGWRNSTARAYLAPARSRPNLTVRTGHFARRILFAGRRAIGVECSAGGGTVKFFAKREVVLAAGAIASPKLLLLSGIGPASELRSQGIDPVLDLPAVGTNLQEHPGVIMSQLVNVPTLNMEAGSVAKVLRHGLNFLLFGRGPASTPIGHAIAFARTGPEYETPNIQLSFTPISYVFTPEGVTLFDAPAVGAAVNVCRPQSRGTIRLRSAEPADAPEIRHELLQSADDVRQLIDGCKLLRRIFQAPSFRPFSVGERTPGDEAQSDADWEAFVRRDAFLMYHPVGTCRMGGDPASVVDPELRVRGIEGLRIADASVMPIVPGANTNAPAIMVAEKASDLIRGRLALRADLSSRSAA